jgi:hypothetical protein
VKVVNHLGDEVMKVEMGNENEGERNGYGALETWS